jgi:cytochrome c
MNDPLFARLALATALTAVGSFGFGCAAEAPATNLPNAANASPAEAQIARGQALYGERCAKCHGAAGEGGSAAPVVGAKALPLDPPAGAKHRTAQFHTAMDVFTFVKATMPADAAGTLSDDDVAAILSFDLEANGVAVGKSVDKTAAAGVVLHK